MREETAIEATMDAEQDGDFIVFSNAGEIDIAAVTTLGVSVKESANAIGMFGTGLKYAIAVLLREGQEIRLWSGLTGYEFGLRRQRIRGEDFEIVHMRQEHGEWQSLHFTTAYGRNWTLENVYRELWSNTKDENGVVQQQQTPGVAAPYTTRLIIRGKAFASTHQSRWGFLLDPSRRPLAITKDIEIYPGESTVVFYRGITAFKLPKPTRYTYNIIRRETLTEDRTLVSGTYYLDQYVKTWITQEAEQAIIQDMVSLGEDRHEQGFYYSSLGTPPSAVWLAAVQHVMKHNPLKLNASAAELFLGRTKQEKLDFQEYSITPEEQAELDATLARVARWGFDYAFYGFTVKIVTFGGANIIARVNGPSEAIVTYAALLDRDLLEHALIEEFVHMRDKVNDETRQMQNVLFREIIRLGRQTTEPSPEGIPTYPAVSHREFIPFAQTSIDDDEIPF